MPTDTSTTTATSRHLPELTPSRGSALVVWAVLASMVAFMARRLPRVDRSERGDIAAGMAWALLGVVAAIAIWGVMQTLGIDLVARIRAILGL